MAEIKCPKCGEVFSVDKAEYNEIVRQIKDKTFKEEVNEKLKYELQIKENEFEKLRAPRYMYLSCEYFKLEYLYLFVNVSSIGNLSEILLVAAITLVGRLMPSTSKNILFPSLK